MALEEIYVPSKSALIEYIRSEYPRTQTARQQAEIVTFCLKNGGHLDGEPIKTPVILEEIEDARRSHVKNLVKKVGLLEEFKPRGAGKGLVHFRVDELYFDPSTKVAELMEDVDLLIEHCEESEKVRHLVAEVVEVDSNVDEIEKAIKEDEEDGIFEILPRYQEVVSEIENSPSVSKEDRDYDSIEWRNFPNKYLVTEDIKKVKEFE